MSVLSLGAGVQSTTLALLAEHGEVEKPDFALFADTGWEPKAVYSHLDWLETKLSYPVHRVSNGSIQDSLTSKKKSKWISIPFFLSNGGMGRRQCTAEFKLIPMQRFIRSLQKEEKIPQPTMIYIGISVDEAIRMKPSRVKYLQNTWPLVDLGMSRDDCKRWMKDQRYPEPPRSACLGCPFHSDVEWRHIKENYPEEWNQTLKLDYKIRELGTSRHKQYMHRTRKPLDQVDFRTLEEMGQLTLFGDECEGLCGV